jgi:hypothetical protein
MPPGQQTVLAAQTGQQTVLAQTNPCGREPLHTTDISFCTWYLSYETPQRTQAAVWPALLHMFGAPTMWVLFDCFIEALAFAMCFTIWLMLIDGMRFHKVRRGRASPRRAPPRVPSPLIPTALSTQAHVYDARFYMFKLPFGMLLLCSYFLLFLVTNPAVDGGDAVGGVQLDKTTLQIVFGLALATNLLLVFWLTFSIVRTLRTLRRIPYLSNRHRQLAFRFFFLHVLMEGGALLIIVIVTCVHALAPALNTLHVAVYTHMFI